MKTTLHNTLQIKLAPEGDEWELGYSEVQKRNIHVPNLRLLLLAFNYDAPGELSMEYKSQRWLSWLGCFQAEDILSWKDELTDILESNWLDTNFRIVGYQLRVYLQLAWSNVNGWELYFEEFDDEEAEYNSMMRSAQLHRHQYELLMPFLLVSPFLRLPELEKPL